MPAPLKFIFDRNLSPQHISLGYGFSLVCASDSRNQHLIGFGNNSSSQVGALTSKNDEGILINPTAITLSQTCPIIGLAAGRAHTLVLCRDRAFTLGNNCYGQCGRPVIKGEIYKHSNVVHSVSLETSLRGMACGCDHSVLLSQKGELFSCGWGADGQTGQGHYGSTNTFSPVLGDTKGVDIVKIVSAGDTNLAVSKEGDVFGWGNSEYNQLRTAMPSSLEPQINVSRHLPLGIGKVVDIACSCTACIALTENGEVFVWGYGILGLGGMVSTVERPTELPGSLFGGPVIGIYGGSSAFGVVNNLGNAYIWGKNRNGSLGLGSNKDNQYFPFRLPIASQVLQIAFGFDHTAAIVKENI